MKPLYYLSFFYSWLVVHMAIAFSVFLLFMIVVHLAIELSVFILFVACGSFGHCIICLSSIHYNGQMNHKSWIEERQIIQWLNEPQATNRIKTDNAMAKW
jgi:hypothetical protein